MAILKILTEYSFIVETNTGEKMGILVNYDEGTTERKGLEFFTSTGVLKFNTISELETILNEPLTYAEIVVSNQ